MAEELGSGRYCRCGNVSVLGDVGIASQVRLRYPLLTQLRRGDGAVVQCLCCNTDVARVEGIDSLHDLDKVTSVTMLHTIDMNELEAETGYSEVFHMVLPALSVQDDAASELPPEIQHTLESAVQKQKAITQTQISEFTSEKKQEFKNWREQARQQARIIAKLAETIAPPGPPPSSPSKDSAAPLAIPSSSNSKTKQTSDLFQKSPVIQHSHPGASPLAAASLTRSQSARASTPSPPTAKTTPPPVALSSSLKSPSSANYSKPVKRVMFQDPPDIEVHSDADEELPTTDIDIPDSVDTEPVISVDDELFDFDETIPGISLESDTTVSPSSSQGSPPAPPIHSPLFAPPLSPFRRRSVEKYDLPDDEEEDPFDSLSLVRQSNGVRFKDPEELVPLASSKPIAITPPSRSFLAEGLGVEEDEDDDGVKSLIERISLKNRRNGSKGGFADQRMLWDIPGDFYRSVPS